MLVRSQLRRTADTAPKSVLQAGELPMASCPWSGKCRFASGNPVFLGVCSLFVNSFDTMGLRPGVLFKGTFMLLVIEHFFIDRPHLTL